MRAFRLAEHGSIDNLERVDIPSPEPGPLDAIVRIHAASLNPRDLMVITGPSPYGARPGLIPLSDGAGKVVGVGSQVTRVHPGDRVVCAFRPGWIDGPLRPATIAGDLGGGDDGLLADEVRLPDTALVKLPDGVGFEAAATLPCAAVTAYRGLDFASLGPGETVLTQGSGGVSLFALKMATAAGARVIAVTGSSAKVARLAALGASDVIDSSLQPDWQDEALALTDGRGVDRIIEVGGAGSLPRSFAAAAYGGLIALIGLLDDPYAQISPLPVMGRMLTLRGVSVGSRADLEAVVSLVAQGRIEPPIDAVFDFEESREALCRMAGRDRFGKIVIRF